MSFTITWSFNTSEQDWVFTDEFCTGTATSTGSWSLAKEAWDLNMTPVGGTAWGAIRLDGLNIPVEIGDTVEFDFSVSSPQANTSLLINVIYDDETVYTAFGDTPSAGTRTLTITVDGTIDKIECMSGRQVGGGIYSQDIEEVRVITASQVVATPGVLRTPENVIDDQGGAAAGGAGGGAGGNIASISASGTSIYIASFNDLGFPTLIKIAAALSADGSVVFDPGPGGRIGVQCGQLNNDVVYVAGSFDGTNRIEKSEDAGSSFNVIDDGTFGTIRSFAVGPNSDNRIIVFDGDNGDIIESLDGGGTWTTINSSVTQLVNSIARFDINPEEIVIGNEGGATDSINYSPNSGADLEDFQTGVYPNADATKVIAN
jgi:hypothetical protein